MTPQAADSLRAVLDSVFTAPEYRWVERRESFNQIGRWLDAFQRWLADLHEAHPAAFRAVMLGMLLLVLAIFAHAAWVFAKSMRAAAARGGALPAAAGVRRDRAWFRREADRLALDGRYAEAVQADFLALVLALDERQRLKFHPSKTPAEYGYEARLDPGPREEFRHLIRTLYEFAFARRPCGAGEFAEWRVLAAPERYATAE